MKKIMAVLLALLMTINIGIFAIAAEGDNNQLTLEADKSSATIGETVKVTVGCDSAFRDMSAIAMKLYYDGAAFEYDADNSTTKGSFELGNPQTDKNGNYVTVSFMDFNGATDAEAGEYATLAFKATAEDSSAEFFVDELEFADSTLDLVSYDIKAPEKVKVAVISQTESKGYSVSLTGTTSVTAGETATVSVEVASEDADTTSYNAYDLTVTYDNAKLSYKSAVAADTSAEITESDGTIRVKGYGADKSLSTAAVTLTFTATAVGSGEVKLTAAKIDSSANAIGDDAPTADITISTAVITVTGYKVTLGSGLQGSATAMPGTDYTFSALEYANYNYTITATVGNKTVSAKDNKDGTYTIAGADITGNLVISAVKEAKSYSVTINGEDVTGAKTATYNTNYTFTLNKSNNYSYKVAVTVDGNEYKNYTVSGSTYTIPGADITGDIVITVTKTAIEPDKYTVTVNGAVGDVTYSAEAVKGADYTFKLTPEKGYTYEVTAKIENKTVTVTNGNDNTYTIAGADVTGNIEITVTKTANITVEVKEYLTVNEQVMYLVTAKCELASGNILKYNGQSMYWSDKYNAYAYLVIGKSLNEETAESFVTIASGDAPKVVYTGDVNGTGNIDVNDAQLVYDIYNVKYTSFDQVSMQKFLNSDMNGDGKVNILDAVAVVAVIH